MSISPDSPEAAGVLPPAEVEMAPGGGPAVNVAWSQAICSGVNREGVAAGVGPVRGAAVVAGIELIRVRVGGVDTGVIMACHW